MRLDTYVAWVERAMRYWENIKISCSVAQVNTWCLKLTIQRLHYNSVIKTYGGRYQNVRKKLKGIIFRKQTVDSRGKMEKQLFVIITVIFHFLKPSLSGYYINEIFRRFNSGQTVRKMDRKGDSWKVAWTVRLWISTWHRERGECSRLLEAEKGEALALWDLPWLIMVLRNFKDSSDVKILPFKVEQAGSCWNNKKLQATWLLRSFIIVSKHFRAKVLLACALWVWQGGNDYTHFIYEQIVGETDGVIAGLGSTEQNSMSNLIIKDFL